METRIQELRKANKVSQAELAEALGVTRQTIISLEKGRYNASLELAHKIAKYFGMTIEEIFIFDEVSRGDVEMEKIRAIVDRQESRKETGMFLLFLGESLFVFSYFMKMSDFLHGMGLGMSMILNLLAVIFLSAKGEE